MKLTRRGAIAAGAAFTVVSARASGPDVGGVEDIINFAWGTVAPNPRDEIEFEDDVYMNELVETGEESALLVRFADGSKLTLGENASAVIDKYVYDPGGAGEQAITLTKGAFRFLSGSIAKENVSIRTPAVTIGIRGTELVLDVAEDGETEFSTVEGEAEATDGAGEKLTVRAEESVLVGRDRRFRGRVRRFRHVSRSPAVAEGLEGARKRWRVRKARKRRAARLRHQRRQN